MSYDPCGTRRLDGEDLIKILAADFGCTTRELREAIKRLLKDVNGS